MESCKPENISVQCSTQRKHSILRHMNCQTQGQSNLQSGKSIANRRQNILAQLETIPLVAQQILADTVFVPRSFSLLQNLTLRLFYHPCVRQTSAPICSQQLNAPPIIEHTQKNSDQALNLTHSIYLVTKTYFKMVLVIMKNPAAVDPRQ